VTVAERAALAALLLLTFALRAAHVDQPIVENYIGRQIPTAMVARNLDRGTSFLRPELDVGPFPNLFLVEPPLYAAAAVALHRTTGVGLEACGRLVSAFGIALGAWGLFGLARRRLGVAPALVAVAAFAAFPLTLRHGRVFQPDALMLGCVLAGMSCWDAHAAGAGRRWLVCGWLLLSAGLSLKFTSAYVLLPLVCALQKRQRLRGALPALTTLVPAAAWYVHAWTLLQQGAAAGGTSYAVDFWLQNLKAFHSSGWAIYKEFLTHLTIRSFTPLGVALALWGAVRMRDPDRLWRLWCLAAVASLVVLSRKLEHEYYLFALAPLVAVACGVGLVDLARRGRMGRIVAAGAAGAFLAIAGINAAPTFQTVPGWVGLPVAGDAIRAHVPPDALLVALDPLIYFGERRGCRLAFYEGVTQAAAEWGAQLAPSDVLGLVKLCQSHGARYVADVPAWSADSERRAFQRAIRRRYKVLVDRPEILLAELP
jgi:hypothetical protein